MPNKNKSGGKGEKGRIERGSKSVTPTTVPKPPPPPKQPSKNDGSW